MGNRDIKGKTSVILMLAVDTLFRTLYVLFPFFLIFSGGQIVSKGHYSVEDKVILAFIGVTYIAGYFGLSMKSVKKP